MNDVMKIARAISVVQPHLDDTKYLEYALGIYRAARKYNVEPSVLIAIAKQETSFREDLPEGAAGEIGIIQIRKMWLKQPKFRREFGNHHTIKDLKQPSKSFLYAAWILKELKAQVTKGSLPYWSFYNAVHFEPRLRYFLAVNKNIAMLRLKENVWNDRAVAVAAAAEEAQERAAARAAASLPALQPKSLPPSTRVADWTQQGRPGTRPATEKELVPAKLAQVSAGDDDLHGLPTGNGNRWIPDALLKVQRQHQMKTADTQDPAKRTVSPSLIRAATDLDVKGFFSTKAIED